MATTHIHGYSDQICVKAGDRIRFMVSVEGAQQYRAEIVRFINGDSNPAGPGPKEEPISTSVSGQYPARFQPIYPGSHIVVEDREGLLNPGTAISVHAFIMATTPNKGVQGIVTHRDRAGKGWALSLDESGRLTLSICDGRQLFQITAAPQLMAGVWYAAGASYDGKGGHATIHLAPIVNSVNSIVGRVARLDAAALHEIDAERIEFRCGAPIIIGGWTATTANRKIFVDRHFNGKVDRPMVYGRALSPAEFTALAHGRDIDGRALLARWDFADGMAADGISSDKVTDISGNDLHGRCVNAPARAMTGYNWRGHEEHFVHAPAEYGAIHFHDDDIEDAGWETSFELSIPETMPSAIYAAKVNAGEALDYIPFAVRRPLGQPAAKIAFLMPTASYMAYSNAISGFTQNALQPVLGHTIMLTPEDVYVYERPELGLSTYDHHSDGSGVCYVSRLRPIPNMRPHYRFFGELWGLAADLHLIDWLNARGFAHDVITDEDLHRDGAALLHSYRVILTGTHPEYYSSAMLDAMEGYPTDGGRLMYLGGNGFYWVSSYHPAKPYLLEVRKGESGSRAWQADPGEYYHSTTGERGGLWRNRGRAPQKIVGVGFAAQGFDRSTFYRRMPDSFDPRARFIFEGIAEDELIGNFGLDGNGAAGAEVDRYDRTLGTPPNTMLLASSENHSDNVQRVVEEIFFNYPGAGGTQDPGVRSDLCYFTTAGGGAVFSTGSIAWCASLSHNHYDNNVSRITGNVLSRFIRDESLEET